ncbi:hypothetical protein ACFZBU_36400 [Embleya sp. NPDC008237]|uniref:hypothetical protein n=1 Tax=Embleya sp. NPDC008237 TaxID=3363978 RepID=UPI0036E50849
MRALDPRLPGQHKILAKTVVTAAGVPVLPTVAIPIRRPRPAAEPWKWTAHPWPCRPRRPLPTDGEFHDYATKRDHTGYRYRSPAEHPGTTLDAVTTTAPTVHSALSCTGYPRSDFIVTPDGGPVRLKINTLPGHSHTGTSPP